MNESAAYLWSLRSESSSQSEIIERFASHYGLDESAASDDVSAALSIWERELLAPLSCEAETVELRLGGTAEEWALTANYRVNGQHVRVSLSDAEFAAEISPRLEPAYGLEHGQPDLDFQIRQREGRLLLAAGAELIASEENPNAIRAILLQEMVRRTEKGRDWVAVLHAGACGDSESCVLLAGKSHSGKTTLCAALVSSGLQLYSDDSAALGSDEKRVSPMPFRLMLREGSWTVLSSRHPELATEPVFTHQGQRVRFLRPASHRIPVSPGKPKALLFVSFSPEEKTVLRPLLPFEALLRLKESGFWVRHERDSIESFLIWLRSIPAYEFLYSDLDDATSRIKDVFYP